MARNIAFILTAHCGRLKIKSNRDRRGVGALGVGMPVHRRGAYSNAGQLKSDALQHPSPLKEMYDTAGGVETES